MFYHYKLQHFVTVYLLNLHSVPELTYQHTSSLEEFQNPFVLIWTII